MVLLGLLAWGWEASHSSAHSTTPPPIEWQKVYGGSNPDYNPVLRETSDGGFIVSGNSQSWPSGNKTSPFYGVNDYWILRLDRQGNKLWEQGFGGSGDDVCTAVVEIPDGGFLFAGFSFSEANGNKTSATKGPPDLWLVRLGNQGQKLWEKCLGGKLYEMMHGLDVCRDGGFILAADSSSGTDGDKSTDSFGGRDLWIIRLDAEGNKLWDRSYGGSADEWYPAVRQTADGGFIVAGSSFSDPSGNKVSPFFGQPGGERYPDYWILRLDSEGHKIWERSFGGSSWDEVRDVRQLHDGGFIVAGRSESGADGNKLTPHFGTYADIWVLRLDSPGNRVWERNLGGDNDDDVGEIIQTWDGGFMIAGRSRSSPGTGTKTSPQHGYCDYWIVRLDESGTELWQESLGGDHLTSLVQTRDGGYVLAGAGQALYGSWDFWILKLRPDTVNLRLLAQPPDAIRQSGVELLLSAPTNLYAIERSTNLTDWFPFQTNQLLGNATNILDPTAASVPTRFYRARQVPPSGRE